MVNFGYTFVGTLFIQMGSIFIHLRVIYTIVVDFLYICERFYTFVGIYTFEGPTHMTNPGSYYGSRKIWGLLPTLSED